ncbi:hypothetical protein [Streptomyces sp. NPDC003006]
MILTTDPDLARGTLEIRRGLLRRTLYLEEFTHRLTMEWLTDRSEALETADPPPKN